MHCHKRPQKNEFENARQLKPCMFLVFFFRRSVYKKRDKYDFSCFFLSSHMYIKKFGNRFKIL